MGWAGGRGEEGGRKDGEEEMSTRSSKRPLHDDLDGRLRGSDGKGLDERAPGQPQPLLERVGEEELLATKLRGGPECHKFRGRG